MARAALYLASDDASWVTGVILDVAGGAVMVERDVGLASGTRTGAMTTLTPTHT